MSFRSNEILTRLLLITSHTHTRARLRSDETKNGYILRIINLNERHVKRHAAVTSLRAAKREAKFEKRKSKFETAGIENVRTKKKRTSCFVKSLRKIIAKLSTVRRADVAINKSLANNVTLRQKRTSQTRYTSRPSTYRGCWSNIIGRNSSTGSSFFNGWAFNSFLAPRPLNRYPSVQYE